MPRRTAIGAALLLASCGSFLNAADPPRSPYLAVVYRYADAMLEHGRDVYGPKQTPMLLSALDRGTMSLLTTRPAAPAGVRRGDRDGLPWEPLVGANPQHDENLLRVLYVLTELSQKPVYREAADAELKWFLENTASPETHLLPWGEHMSWNVATDQPLMGEGAVHEFSRPWVLWERCYELAPAQSKAFALGLWEHQVADHKTGAFDRHGAYDHHAPKDGMDFPRHAGFFIRTWAESYAHIHDDVFLQAIETLLARFERKVQPGTGLISDVTGRPASSPPSALSLVIDCAAAARVVPQPLSDRLGAFVAAQDKVFCSLGHDLNGAMGFVVMADAASGKPSGLFTKVWEASYGAWSTGSVGLMCVSRYQNGGGPAYRDLVVAAADAYLRTSPGEDVDAWPLTFGHAISLELAAWRITAREAYLKRADALGAIAVDRFWEGQALPRASLTTGHYESITGADTLALSLVDLHLAILHITAVEAPSNTIDR